MNHREEKALLEMKIKELQKQLKDKNKEIKKKDKVITTITEDNLVMSKALRSTDEKLRVQLFLKFGSKSEKFRKLFNIPDSYTELLYKDKEDLTEEEVEILEQGKAIADKIEQEELALLNKTQGRRNRNPKNRKRGNSNGKIGRAHV